MLRDRIDASGDSGIIRDYGEILRDVAGFLAGSGGTFKDDKINDKFGVLRVKMSRKAVFFRGFTPFFHGNSP